MKSRAGAFGIAVMLFLLFALACGGTDSPPPAPPPGNNDASTPSVAEGNPRGSGTTSTQAIGAVGGTVTVGAVELQFPAGAVPAGTQITVTESTMPAPADVVAVTPVYSFAPEGIVFSKPVSLRITFSGSDANLHVYWSRLSASTNYDPIGTQIGAGVATAQITHFSTGFLGRPKTADVTTACVPTPCARATNGAACSLCSSACDVADSLCVCSATTWSCNAKPEVGAVAPVAFNPPAGSYPSALALALTTTTPEAEIHYTLDGSDPVSTSSLYVAANPIAIATTTTVKALAIRTGYPSSNIATATYTIAPTSVAAVTFTPAEGSYAGEVDVALATTTTSATIRYTLDGTEPGTTSAAYTGQPIAITATKTLKAFATRAGYADSAVTSATFTITQPTVAPVTFTPGGGQYVGVVSLATATPGAAIYYTSDGSDPGPSSFLYSTSIAVTGTTTLKAIATKAGLKDSAITSATYTYPPIVVAPVDFSPPSGFYASPFSAALTSQTPNAKIYYTLDGSTPTTASSLYNAASGLLITKTTTVKAFATRTNDIDSAVTSATYTIGP